MFPTTHLTHLQFVSQDRTPNTQRFTTARRCTEDLAGPRKAPGVGLDLSPKHGRRFPICLNFLTFYYTIGTHVAFIFSGYNPYFLGIKPSFFMVLGSKGTYAHLQHQLLPFVTWIDLPNGGHLT